VGLTSPWRTRYPCRVRGRGALMGSDREGRARGRGRACGHGRGARGRSGLGGITIPLPGCGATEDGDDSTAATGEEGTPGAEGDKEVISRGKPFRIIQGSSDTDS
jgi:hypothetical protein